VVQLRRERTDIASLVVNADYGVGILWLKEVGGIPALELTDNELTWAALVEHRSEWLGLMTSETARQQVMTHLSPPPHAARPRHGSHRPRGRHLPSRGRGPSSRG
jgi:hypothetical protein